jgi:hypothetical protein
MSGPEGRDSPSVATLAAATLVALIVAGVVLVIAVLPAEYGIDPTGIGESLGLVVLSEPGAPAAGDVRPDGIQAESSPYRSDSITFELGPSDSVEYKYRLEPGQSMIYAWESTGLVRTEMHSEPDGAPEGTAEFFEIIESSTAAQGSYTAPFPGIHGWYWLNLSETAPATVTLISAGFYEYSMRFSSGGSRRRFEPAAVSVAAEAPPDLD